MNYPLCEGKSIAPGVYFSPRLRTSNLNIIECRSIWLLSNSTGKRLTDRARRSLYPALQGSKSCPDFAVLQLSGCAICTALLGMQASTNLAIICIIALGIVGIDSRFALENEDMVQRCAALLAEILFDPDITNGRFNEKNTELEKQYLLVQSSIDGRDQR